MITSQFIQACQSGDENAIQALVRTYQRSVFQLALSIIDDGAETLPGAENLPGVKTLPKAVALPKKETQPETETIFKAETRPGKQEFSNSAGSAAAEAEIATRQTFITAIDRMGRYREDTNFETWLYRIAIQISLRRSRRWKTRQWLSGLFRRSWRSITPRASEHPASATQDANDHAPVESAPEQANEQSEKTPPDPRLHAGDEELWSAVRRLDEKLRVPIVLRYYHDFPISEIAHLLHISEGAVHARLDAAREKIARSGA